MAYQINLTDGTPFATIADGTINTQSNMVLVGKNYAGYGEFLDGNFIHLLENAASVTAPGNPLTGQLWWDKVNNVMMAYNSSGWKSLAFSQTSASAPSSTTRQEGDMWWDTVNFQLKVWNGSDWYVVGPAYTPSQGTTGAIPLSLLATDTNTYIVTGLYSAGSLVGILNPNVDFIPNSPTYSTPFPTVFNGLTVWQDGRQGGNVVNYGNVYITAGAKSNAAANATITVTTTGANVTGYLTASTNVSAVANVSGGNIIATTTVITPAITNSGANGVGNIGSATGYFNTVFAKATTAQYADLAENYVADQLYTAGTVVVFGGDNEVTANAQDADKRIAGVVSTNPAHLMNSGLTGANVVAVALTGRVPTSVVGVVRKGDTMVAAGNGAARAEADPKVATVIGKALEDFDGTSGIIEIVVGRV